MKCAHLSLRCYIYLRTWLIETNCSTLQTFLLWLSYLRKGMEIHQYLHQWWPNFSSSTSTAVTKFPSLSTIHDVTYILHRRACLSVCLSVSVWVTVCMCACLFACVDCSFPCNCTVCSYTLQQNSYCYPFLKFHNQLRDLGVRRRSTSLSQSIVWPNLTYPFTCVWRLPPLSVLACDQCHFWNLK